MSMEEKILGILNATFSPDNNIRNAAEKELNIMKENMVKLFLLMLKKK